MAEAPTQAQERVVRTKERIIAYLEQGLWFKDACIAAGITERTGHRYKMDDVSFVSHCEAAIAKYHEKLIRCVNQAALKDGKIALEILKIRFPEEWNPKYKVKITNSQEELQRIHDMIYGPTCPREVH